MLQNDFRNFALRNIFFKKNSRAVAEALHSGEMFLDIKCMKSFIPLNNNFGACLFNVIPLNLFFAYLNMQV